MEGLNQLPVSGLASQLPAYTGNARKALDLLGSGVQPVQVAAAIGVSEGYISQLLADEQFQLAVAQKRYDSLLAASERDASYDAIEDELLQKLKTSLAFMTKTGEILAAIKVINGAKRRGASSTVGASSQSQVVQLVLPAGVRARFAQDAQGQVVEVQTDTGSHSLLTATSSGVKQLLAAQKQAALASQLTSQLPASQLPASQIAGGASYEQKPTIESSSAADA